MTCSLSLSLSLKIFLKAMMDRDRKDELPKMQVEFIDVVCTPLYTSLSESFPWIKPLLDGCLSNREKWADMAEKVSIWLSNSFQSMSFKIGYFTSEIVVNDLLKNLKT